MEYNPHNQQSTPRPNGYTASPYPPQQVPAYNVLPDGQVQMIYTLPAGSAPASAYQGYSYPSQPPQPQYMQYPMGAPYVYSRPPPSDGFALAIGATFYVGLFTFVPHLVSLILTFVMLGQGYLTGNRKSTVLAMAIVELITWLFCASFSWFYTNHCTYWGNGSSSCYTNYWGWIAIVIWFVVALSCGITRVIFIKNQPQPYIAQH